jgi:hypothetical protein
MVKKIFIGLAVIVVIFLGVVAMQPSEFTITRAATISAPPPVVFAQVNDFHNWGAWDPWAKLDPNAKSTFEGPDAGTGAVLRWEGNSEVGKGSMKIIESRPSELIRIDLEFQEPMAGTALTEFTFAPQGDQTLVTWAMSGTNNFMSKAVCIFMDMDKMLGGQFETGLANLKMVSEAIPTESVTDTAAIAPAQ